MMQDWESMIAERFAAHGVVVTCREQDPRRRNRQAYDRRHDRTPVHPREAFKHAILDNATSVIFAHNHPSGSLEPSPEDISITRVLCAAGKILQIPVLDHIILSRAGITSICRRDPDIFEQTFSKAVAAC